MSAVGGLRRPLRGLCAPQNTSRLTSVRVGSQLARSSRLVSHPRPGRRHCVAWTSIWQHPPTARPVGTSCEIAAYGGHARMRVCGLTGPRLAPAHGRAHRWSLRQACHGHRGNRQIHQFSCQGLCLWRALVLPRQCSQDLRRMTHQIRSWICWGACNYRSLRNK